MAYVMKTCGVCLRKKKYTTTENARTSNSENYPVEVCEECAEPFRRAKAAALPGRGASLSPADHQKRQERRAKKRVVMSNRAILLSNSDSDGPDISGEDSSHIGKLLNQPYLNNSAIPLFDTAPYLTFDETQRGKFG